MYYNLFIKRKENHLTQEDVAKMLGITTQSYHMKEKGKSDFKLMECKFLAEKFETSMDELFKN